MSVTIEFINATDDDMFDVLDIRNACKDFFTHYTEHISVYEQREWWSTKEENGYRIWLVVVRDVDPDDCNGYLVGFCMLRRVYDSGRTYATLALYPQWRGQGIGTAMYKFLVSQQDETWIDVRNNNVASIQAAINAGFQMHYTGAEFSEMIHRASDTEAENSRKAEEYR